MNMYCNRVIPCIQYHFLTVSYCKNRALVQNPSREMGARQGEIQ